MNKRATFLHQVQSTVFMQPKADFYPDAEFAHHYDPKKKSVLREEDRMALFKHLKAHLPL